ncbi:MAG: RNA polymerase sigma-70 factor (ECF subfamily) [Oceanicoccus sp.]|jgi:RNA polymerase sigma-70 factor (ECF subfamily)
MAIQEDDLDGLRAQNHTAFSHLVARYHCQFKTVARSMVGDSIAEEVAQEAWVSIFNALPGFEGRSSLKTWLFTIVGNHAKTRLRKESRMKTVDDNGKAADGYLSDETFNQNGHWDRTPALWEIESPDALLEEKQLRLCIEHTLSILPNIQRAAFTLRDIEQQRLEDICNILNVTNSNVRVLLHRARITLMQVIDHYQETGEC